MMNIDHQCSTLTPNLHQLHVMLTPSYDHVDAIIAHVTIFNPIMLTARVHVRYTSFVLVIRSLNDDLSTVIMRLLRSLNQDFKSTLLDRRWRLTRGLSKCNNKRKRKWRKVVSVTTCRTKTVCNQRSSNVRPAKPLRRWKPASHDTILCYVTLLPRSCL